jgi:uncharacterized protein YjbI with pentapeptide repeats
VSTFRRGPRTSSLLSGLALVLLTLVACPGGDAPPTPQKPHGSLCANDGECEKGLCLKAPGRSERQCTSSCQVEGSACASGGLCVVFESGVLACSQASSCSDNADCGANAACVPLSRELSQCQCFTHFQGDSATACGVCNSENARKGCALQPLSLPEVKGHCESLDTATVAGECTRVEDCPDPTRFGCIGFQPAVVADPPCSCTDLRGLDLSPATDLRGLQGAWYDAATQWPQEFDPTQTGALGPKAKLAGIDLSGRGLLSVARPVVGGERLKAEKLSGSVPSALRHSRLVSGSVQLQVGDARFNDEARHGVLAGKSAAGSIDYAAGTVTLGLVPAPTAQTPAEVSYRYRVQGVPLRPISTVNTSVHQATTFEPVGTAGPVVPRSAVVRLTPEPLVPDVAPDGRRKDFSFTGPHALAQRPLVPGSLRVLADDLELTDDTTGKLTDGTSTGTIDYATGALTLKLARALDATAVVAAQYEVDRDVELQPDAPFDGLHTHVTFSRERALPSRPLPGTLRLTVAGVVLKEAAGQLTDSDGRSLGSVDLETGEIAVDLATAPAAGTRTQATFSSKAEVTLTDRAGPRLTSDGGASGSVDSATAQVQLEFPSRLHPSTQALLDFERQAEKTLPPGSLGGSTKSADLDLGPEKLGPGSVRLQLGPEGLTPQPAFDGGAKDFSLTLAKKPVAPGTLAVEVGGLRLTEVAGDGVLRDSEGKAQGRVNLQTGVVTLKLATPPPASTKAVARYAQRREDTVLIPDLPPDGQRLDLSFTGERAASAPMRPGSVEVTVSEGLVPDAPYDGRGTEQVYPLQQKPVALGSVVLQVGGVTLTDALEPGTLRSADGRNTGTINPETGVVTLRLAAPPATGTQGHVEYGVASADVVRRPLTPDVAFDGVRVDPAFSGVNALGTGVSPGSLRVTLESVPLVPNAAYDGVARRAAYGTPDKPALVPPVVPGSVEVHVGSTTLRDARSTGELSAADGSSGTLDSAQGVLTLDFTRAPPGGTTSTVTYRTQVNDAPLTPERAFDGRRTRFVFAGPRALKPTPLVPGSVTVLLGSLRLAEDAPGHLSGPGGNTGTIDPDTGTLTLELTGAPPLGASAKASYQGQAAVVLVERKGADASRGELLDEKGNKRGDFTYASGRMDLQLSAAPAAGLTARATFSRREVVVPDKPFDGLALQHRLQLAKTPVQRGSVALVLGSTTLKDKGRGLLFADDGSTGQINYRTGEVTVQPARAVPAGTLALADYGRCAAVVLSDAATPGKLRAADGSSGQVDARTGVMRLSLARSPPRGAQVTLTQDVPAEVVLVDSEGLLKGEGGRGTVDYATGKVHVELTAVPPPGTEPTVAYTVAAEVVERTDLKGIALPGADLKGANLSYTDLRDANLADADLTGADLTGADLTGANLRGANLTRATLEDARLGGANLLGANLAGARLSGASGIDLTRLSMPSWYAAGLTECKEISVPGCKQGSYYPEQLVQSLLAGRIDPRKEGLEGAMLEGADLSGLGDLSGARLRGANLRGANLRGLRLAGADLSGALLDEALLTDVQAPDTVCPGSDSPCYDGGRACRGSTQACLPKAGAGLKLTGASLVKTQLDRAVLTGAEASNTVMTGANLVGTDASRAKLVQASLDDVRTNAATKFIGVDLSQASLVGADVRGMVLDGAKLVKADLSRIVADERTRAEGATFTGANLTGACLTNSALLRGAKLEGVTAPRASLAGAQLQGTDFSGVDLSGATLASDGAGPGDPCHCTPERGPVTCGLTRAQGALFKQTNLSGATLSATDLRGVTLEKSDLRGARMERTDLRNATLSGANLSGSDLRTAILSSAKLLSVNLSGADLSGNELLSPLLTGADLTGANLRRTVMRNADLTGALLDGVSTDSTTELRGAILDFSTIRGCIRANLSDAVLKNASLLQAAFITPNNQSYDAGTDFNCRMDFEGALLPATSSKQCGDSATFPAPGSWIEAGRSTTGVYTKARLLTQVATVRKKLDCAYLPEVDLRGRELLGASLRGAKLDKARLGRDDVGRLANLSKAQMQGAQLSGASLEWTNLSGTDLSGAVLTGASLENSDLRGASLSNVVLDSATRFQYAKYSCPGRTDPGCTVFPSYDTFRWRQLKMLGPQSDLSGADLSGYPNLNSPPVDLSGANLKDAKFNWSNVSGVNFSGANLETGAFSHAEVSGANFSNTNLKSANFTSASLNGGTSFSGANLMEANFVASSGVPGVGNSLCNEQTAFNSASAAYVFLLDISIQGSFPLYFPVITLEFVPGWNVGGQCCFPVHGGVRLGC